MKKSLLLCLALSFSGFVAAQSPEETLLSAQIQYQNALKAQNAAKERATKAQTRLETARGRVQDAQRELQDAQTESADASAFQSKSVSDYEEAGRNLDRAWGIK